MTPYTLKGCYIAGGAVLSKVTKQPISDYDIYPKNSVARDEAITELCENGFVLTKSDKAVTIKTNDVDINTGERIIYQVMIIDEGYSDVSEIFELFDFTVCMAAYDCDTKEFIHHKDFYKDVASRTIRFNTKTRYPFASLIRTKKYQRKGYFLPKSELLKIGLAISKHEEISSWDQLESSLGGFYGRRVTLGQKDNEYSFDKAIDVLDTIGDESIVYELDDNLPYANIDAEELILSFSKGNKYFELPSGEILISDKENNLFISKFKEELIASMFIENNVEMDENTIIKSWKRFGICESDEGILKPFSNLAKKDFTYNIGGITDEPNAPYMFVEGKKANKVGHMYGGAKDSVIHEVFFSLKDIKKALYDSICVSRLVVGDRIEEGSYDFEIYEIDLSAVTKL